MDAGESDALVLNCLKVFKNIRCGGMNLRGQQEKREETIFLMERGREKDVR